MPRRRLTSHDYQQLAQRRGFLWRGSEIQPANTRSLWSCGKHSFEATYGHIYSGRGCPLCRPNAPKTLTDYQNAGTSGIYWAGLRIPLTSKCHTKWKCQEGHEWNASLGNILRGRRCPYCSLRYSPTEELYFALALERGFKWIGPRLVIRHSKTTWQCGAGHTWQASYTQLKATGSGCPTCYEPTRNQATRKVSRDYHAIAEGRGYQWLGPATLNAKSKTEWQCKKGHSWLGTYNDLQVGQGCPKCVDIVNGRRVSNPQRQLCLLLNGELNAQCGPLSIDVAITRDNVRIAVEYDSWYWHAGRENEDQAREAQLRAAGWRILRVKGKTSLPSIADLTSAIAVLVSGKERTEITLPDWGRGPTFRKIA
jgi:hypothetical protein